MNLKDMKKWQASEEKITRCRLHGLEIIDWASYKHVVVQFAQNKLYWVFGPSDVGKTNILRAIDLVLAKFVRTGQHATMLFA